MIKARKKIFLVAGARPNFMKIAPLWHVLQKHTEDFDTQIVHTGQHYDDNMSSVFFTQLQLPPPHFHLAVGSGTHGKQTAQTLEKVERVIHDESPDLVVVVGDVNSTLAAALAAVKLGVKVAHVEAGLRSFDKTMPEEINRVVTDHISDYLFVTEPIGVEHLAKEGIASDKVHLVGNVMIDTLRSMYPHISALNMSHHMHLKAQSYAVITLHRVSNVDNTESLTRIVHILHELSLRCRHIIFPLHPRTRKRLEQCGLMQDFIEISGLTLCEPLAYFEFLSLVSDAQLVMSDSGGIQAETTWMGVPCITLRDTTESPLTVTHGTNQLMPLMTKNVVQHIDTAVNFDKSTYTPPQLWDGHAAERIVDILDAHLN